MPRAVCDCGTCRLCLRRERDRSRSPERIEARRAAQKEWRDRNKEERAASIRKWRNENKEHIEKYAAEYRNGNEAYRLKRLETGREYYRNVIKNDPEKLARRTEYRNARDKALPEQRKARSDKYRATHRVEIAESERARYRLLREDERKKLYQARAEYQRQWREANKERLREAQAKYWAENIERCREKCRANYRKNPLPYIQRAYKRLGLLVGNYTQDDIQQMYASQKGRCLGCRESLKGKFEIDHIMPLSLDPSGDRLENLQLLCRTCNRQKHAKHPDIWAASLGRLFA